MGSRRMSLLPRATLHSDSEQLHFTNIWCLTMKTNASLLFFWSVLFYLHVSFLFSTCIHTVLLQMFRKFPLPMAEVQTISSQQETFANGANYD